MSACNIMSRVLLPKKEPAIAEVTFVPGGSPVPAQYNIPLAKKVPMFPTPTGALELFTSKLGHQAYINKQRHGFDLSDPYNYNIDCSYNSVQDPHVLHIIRTPAMKKKLKELGQLTQDDRVRCTLKQFNNFRAFLKCKALIDFRNQLEEEKTRIPKVDVGESLEVVAIEHRVHEQEVRSRRLKYEEETFAKYQSILTQSERKMSLRKRKHQDQNGVLARKRASNEKHRQDVYRRSIKIVRQRARSKLKSWKTNAKKHIQHLQDMEATRIVDLEEKLQEKWEARRQNELVYEELVEASRISEKDRRDKTLHLLGLEMNRRWQLQANKLQMLKDVSRKIQEQREEVYARNLINAFAKSSILNPSKTTRQQLISPSVPEHQKFETSKSKVSDLASIPKFKTVFLEPVKKSLWVLEKELKKMGLTSNLHAIGARISEKEISLRKLEMESALSACSGTTIDSFIIKKKKRKAKARKSYPTSVELTEGERSSLKPEICVVRKREDIVNDIVEDTHDSQEFEGTDSQLIKEDEMLSREASSTEGFLYGIDADDLEMMEVLLSRLLENVQDGKLNQADLMQLTVLCSSMQGIPHLEQTTSTTSLMAHEIVAHSMAMLREDIIMRRLSPHDLLAVAANIKACRSETSSVSSGHLELLMKETMARTVTSIDIDEDDYNEYFLEQMLRRTVTNLTTDIEQGTLSRTNVREIGSALAQAVMDDMDSDDSLMAEDTLMTILQQLQMDIDMGQIEEHLLDKALATLVSSYGQVLRGSSNIDVIKDFVLYVLLRARQDLEEEIIDKAIFLKELQCAKMEANSYGLELPDLPEIVEVTSKAIGKFKGIGKPDQAIVSLIKMILGPGRKIMPATAKSRVQWISQSMIEQAEESQAQLQLVLDLTANVCSSFIQQMNEDIDFARAAERILGSRFLVMILSYWGQLDLDMEKETVGVQTMTEELAHVVCVRATLAENVVLVCFNWLWQDALQNCLPVCIMPHVALDTAEFPSTRPLLDRIRSVGSYLDKMNLVDEMVLKKVRKVGQELQEGGLGYEEAKALLTICLHAYLREVVFCDCSEDISENGSEPPGMVSNVQFLITTCARSVLEFVQNKVARRLSALGHTAVELSFVTEILMETASDSMAALSTFVINNSEAAEDEMVQLDPLIKTSQWKSPRKDSQSASQEVHPFLKKLIGMLKRGHNVCLKSVAVHKPAKTDFKVVKDLIRRELWQVAKEVSCLFNGLVSLHNLLPPKPSFTNECLLKFIVSLLLELRHAITEETLSLDVAFEFVKKIADKKCPDEAKESAEKLVDVILRMVKDIELKNAHSDYYIRMVKRLSKVSLEKKEGEDVAEGMAAIAHLLSNVDQSVLTTFLQSTLLSMLRNIRALRYADDVEKEISPQSSASRITALAPPVEHSPPPVEHGPPPAQEIPRESYFWEDEEDNVAVRDLIPEAKIVVHVALQKTMERMGASPLPSEFPVHTSQTIVHDFVLQIQDKEQTSAQPLLDKSLTAYAQGLASEISKNLQDEANAGSPLSNKSIANVIIGNTLKSINSGIRSGKIHLSIGHHEAEGLDPTGSESLNRKLSFCVSTTLKAVKSELNLVNLAEGAVGDDTGLSEEESRQAIEKARCIVDYLIKRVGSDIDEARVEFQLTPDNQLSVVQLSPSSSELSKKRSSDSSNNFWKGSPSTIAPCVFNTFHDVLLELQKHNEFFDPRLTQEPGSRRDSSVMPGLPYLVENFILKHLLDIARTLPAATSKTPRKLKKESLLVARIFHDILQHLLQESVVPPETSSDADSETQEIMRRRKFILEVLDNALSNAIPSKYLTSPLSATDIAREMEINKAGGKLVQVMSVMQGILTSVQQSHEEEVPVPTPQPYPAPGDTPGLADVVIQTTQQTAIYIREGQVQDHDVARLCKAFEKEVGEEAPTEVLQETALEGLERLVVDVRQGRIPRKSLQRAAKELNIRGLEKDATISGSDSQAVSGLMDELTDKTPMPYSPQPPRGSHDSRQHIEDSEEGERTMSLRGSRKESLNERTVSKTDVRDPSENRREKQSFSRIYSTTTPQVPALESYVEEESDECREMTGERSEDKGKMGDVSSEADKRTIKSRLGPPVSPRLVYVSSPMDIPNFIHVSESESGSIKSFGGEDASVPPESDRVHETEDTADAESQKLDRPTETDEKTDKGGLQTALISGLSDAVGSPMDSEHYLPSEVTATGEGDLRKESTPGLMDTVSSLVDNEHDLPLEQIEASEAGSHDVKAISTLSEPPDTGFMSEGQWDKEPADTGENTGEGGLQIASIPGVSDTVGSPMEGEHCLTSEVTATGEGDLRTDSTPGLMDTVSSLVDNENDLPLERTEESESGLNDGTEDTADAASEADLQDVNASHTEAPDTGFQTDSQWAEAPLATGENTVSDNDSRDSVSTNLPDDEKQGESTLDWNRSAVTSSRTNHLARIDTMSRSSSPSLVAGKVKATDSYELQKSPSRKYKKKMKRSKKRDSSSNQKFLCEELLSPLQKWRKLFDQILPITDGECNTALLSQGSRRCRRTDNPKTKHRKRSVSQKKLHQNEPSLSTKTTVDTSDGQPRSFNQDDVTEAASDPSPTRGRVGAQKWRTYLRKPGYRSAGKLPNVTESTPAPREDRFSPVDIQDESGASYSAPASRSRLHRTLDGATSRSRPVDPCPSSSHHLKTGTLKMPHVKKNRSHKSKCRKDAHGDSASSPVVLTTVTALPVPSGQQPKDSYVQSLTSSCRQFAQKLQKTDQKLPVHETTLVSQSSSKKKGPGLPAAVCSKTMSKADVEAWLLEEQRNEGRDTLQKEAQSTRQLLHRAVSSRETPRLPACAPPARTDAQTFRCEVSTQQQQQRQQHQQEQHHQHQQQGTKQLAKDRSSPRDTEQHGCSPNFSFSRQLSIAFKPQPPPIAKSSWPEVEKTLDADAHQRHRPRVRLLGVTRGKHRQTGFLPSARTKALESLYNGSSSRK